MERPFPPAMNCIVRSVPGDRPLIPALLGVDWNTRQVQVCAWCGPGQTAFLEQRARAMGFTVSHGICPDCAATLLRSAGLDTAPTLPHQSSLRCVESPPRPSERGS